MFKISTSVAQEYRKLKYNPDARSEWSLIPFSSLVWEDEHPGGRCAMPDMDEESTIAILNLAEARTLLWLEGQVPKDLKKLWDDAKVALPEWPGFNRLSITEQEKRVILNIREKMDAFEEDMRRKP